MQAIIGIASTNITVMGLNALDAIQIIISQSNSTNLTVCIPQFFLALLYLFSSNQKRL